MGLPIAFIIAKIAGDGTCANWKFLFLAAIVIIAVFIAVFLKGEAKR